MYRRQTSRFIVSLALVVASLGILTAQDIPLTWLEKELAASGSDWKIASFHH